MSAKTEIIEHIDPESVVGVTVIYTLDAEYKHHVDFFATEFAGLGPNDAGEYVVPLYTKRGAASSMDHETDPHGAEVFVSGSVKWYGCVNYEVGDQDLVMMHACSRRDLERVSHVLTTIYERCGELMQARGVNVLEDQFRCTSAEGTRDGKTP